MQHKECRCRRDERKTDEAEDEEGGVATGLLRGLGDAEGADEGVGEEIEELHGLIIALVAGQLQIPAG